MKTIDWSTLGIPINAPHLVSDQVIFCHGMQSILQLFKIYKYQNWSKKIAITLREKCSNTELFLVRIFLYSDWISKSPFSIQIQENTDQKWLLIWTLFAQCRSMSASSSISQDQEMIKGIGKLKNFTIYIFLVCVCFLYSVYLTFFEVIR